MASIEQIQDFNRFVEQLPDAEREHLSMDEIYDRWRQLAFADEDVAAVRKSLDDFEAGERGEPAEDVLAEFRAKRAAGKKP